MGRCRAPDGGGGMGSGGRKGSVFVVGVSLGIVVVVCEKIET